MKYLLALLVMFYCGSIYGDEWVRTGEIRPNVNFNYVYVPQPSPPVMLVLRPEPYLIYVPVVTYQNVLVEKYSWCWVKKYEVVPVAQNVLVPVWKY